MVSNTPRNVRDNNPGNVRLGGSWKGLRPASMMTPEQEMERTFCVFLDPHWGFRALALVLRSYKLHHNIDTIQELINRWAPPNENNTNAYIEAVSNDSGINPKTIIDLNDIPTLVKISRAITIHETGAPFGKYWFEADLQSGVNTAF